MNCRGCGVVLEPSEEQVNTAVDQILETSLKDAEKKGGVCPLCGHSKAVPYSQRKSVLFILLLGFLLIFGVTAIVFREWRLTERSSAVSAAVARMRGNADVVRFVGDPIKVESGVDGDVRHDETGWKEVRLMIPVRGPKGRAQVHVIGGKGTGSWTFTTFEVVFEKERKKLDLISGRIVEYDSNAYVDVHTQSSVSPVYLNGFVPEARFDGNYPCVFATVNGTQVIPQLGKCAMPTGHTGVVNRFEADLRDGSFVLRESDLDLSDIFNVPLTRSYRSNDWAPSNPVHAFGRNANHPYDIAPVGSRNPYTYQLLVLEDGEFLCFDRTSKGTGYADAVYQHSETSTQFYKATQSWNGNGWTMKLADGSAILFPESYNAKNMAQGAPVEMRDAKGNRLELRRDSARNLQEIRTPHGHWIRFNYDGLARITRAEDDAGDWAQYGYNSDGMLTAVSLSSGRQRHYDYEGALMTQIRDEGGHILIRNSYQNGLLSRQAFGNGAVCSYRYDWTPNSYYPNKVAVTFPDQRPQEISVSDSVPEFVRNFHR